MGKSLKIEILRKMFHLLELPVVLTYSFVRYFWDERVAILALTALLLFLLEVEYVRLEMKLKHPGIKAISAIFRPKERNNVASTVFFITATIIVFGAFDYSIAMLALLLTVFGDLVSALVGISYGRYKLFKKKTYEGFFAGLAANLFVGWIFIPEFPLIFISMAVVASIVELLTNKLDDNITVPLFSGFFGQMLVYIFVLKLPEFPEPLGWMFHLFT